MRQTENYKLNLLDGEDKLSPKPLNENMEKVDRELAAKDLNLLRAVGTGGCNARIAFGQYVGTGVSHGSVEVDFFPVLVQVAMVAFTGDSNADRAPAAFVRPAETAYDGGAGMVSQSAMRLTWNSRGVSWRGDTAGDGMNASGANYCWVAVGYDDNDYGEA